MCDRCLLLNKECSLPTLLQSMHHGRMSQKIRGGGETISVVLKKNNTHTSRKILIDRSSDKRNLTTENGSAVVMWNDLLGAVKLHWHSLCQE